MVARAKFALERRPGFGFLPLIFLPCLRFRQRTSGIECQQYEPSKQISRQGAKTQRITSNLLCDLATLRETSALCNRTQFRTTSPQAKPAAENSFAIQNNRDSAVGWATR